MTGGRNGYGAKLANIFSSEFTVETADSSEGKRYKQVWKDNMMKVRGGPARPIPAARDQRAPTLPRHRAASQP